MTERKTIAESLLFMLTHPVVTTILDRQSDITGTIKEVKSWWGYDLFKRRPGPAYYDERGNFHETDLDLACFLYELSKRGAVVNLPMYQSKRAAQFRGDQKLISKSNRHGKIISLAANKDLGIKVFLSISSQLADLNLNDARFSITHQITYFWNWH